MNSSCSIRRWCSRRSRWPIGDSSCARANRSNSPIEPYSEELSWTSIGRAELPGIGVGGRSTRARGGEGVGLRTTKGMGDPDRDLLATSSTSCHRLLSRCVMCSNIRSYLRVLNLSHCAPIDRRYSRTRTSRSRAALISNWRRSHDSTARGSSRRQSAMSYWTLDSSV